MKETDWRAELETFGKGVADDSHEAQDIMHKGLSSLESFPRQATAHLPAGLGAGLEGFGEHISGGVDPTLVQQRINKVNPHASALPMAYSRLSVFPPHALLPAEADHAICFLESGGRMQCSILPFNSCSCPPMSPAGRRVEVLCSC